MRRLPATLAIMSSKTHYQSYLIRFQRGSGQEHWRVTLQEVRSAKTIYFATEQELIHYLLEVLHVTSCEIERTLFCK